MTRLTKELIRAFRKEMGWTQTQFAEVLGCSLRAVQQWESGSSPPAYMGLVFAALKEKLEPWAATPSPEGDTHA